MSRRGGRASTPRWGVTATALRSRSAFAMPGTRSKPRNRPSVWGGMPRQRRVCIGRATPSCASLHQHARIRTATCSEVTPGVTLATPPTNDGGSHDYWHRRRPTRALLVRMRRSYVLDLIERGADSAEE
jgi:hypothetical protein